MRKPRAKLNLGAAASVNWEAAKLNAATAWPRTRRPRLKPAAELALQAGLRAAALGNAQKWRES